MRDRSPRLPAVLLLVLPLAFATPGFAQSGLDHLDDASTTPRGLLRLRAITVWQRFDNIFTDSGVVRLGSVLTTDSLGPTQVPSLTPIQALVQSASGSPFKLTLGQSSLSAMVRQEIVPIALEYGVTNRFSITVFAPIVRKRVSGLFQLDTNTFGANVGPNPFRTSANAQQNNDLVQTQFNLAAVTLQNKLTTCNNNPAVAGCATLLPRAAQAQQLVQGSRLFAADLAGLYGGGGGAGQAFVPIDSSAAQAAIATRVVNFNLQFKDFLATSQDFITAIPRAAGGPAGVANFQQFLVEDAGRDSVNVQRRVGFGDVEVGFRFGVIDRPQTARRNTGIQLTVASSLRMPTGSTQTVSEVAPLNLGDGSWAVDSRAIAELRYRRAELLAAADVAISFKDRDTTNALLRNSRVTYLALQPAFHLSEAFAFHGAYTLQSTDRFGSTQLVGGGFSYSTLSAYKAGKKALPLETRFTHLEAVTGSNGLPKFFRDQIELRIYFRLF